MDEEIYRRLRRELEREHEQKIAALDRVWSLLQGQGSQATANEFRLEPPSPKRGVLLAAVRQVVEEFDGHFDINDVQEAIRARHPEVPQPTNPTSVSGALRKLYSDEVIELVEPGLGPHPARYRFVRRDRTARRRTGSSAHQLRN